MRGSVKWFAEKMNERLEENAHKDNHGWSDWETEDLISRAENNCFDVSIADDKETAIKHAADIANYAMMIADNWEESE